MNASISYSHIIVGGGAAGCVLACRLSENKDFKILLIEAGGKGRFDPTLKVPLMTAILLRGRRRLWNFKTMPEHGLNNRTVDLPRGKVLGGSTSVNGMVYARGLSLDYDFWAQNGMPGWSWESVQPYFLKSEKRLLHLRYAVLNAFDIGAPKPRTPKRRYGTQFCAWGLG